MSLEDIRHCIRFWLPFSAEHSTAFSSCVYSVLLSFVEQLMTSGRLSTSQVDSSTILNGQNGDATVSDDTEQASLDDVAESRGSSSE